MALTRCALEDVAQRPGIDGDGVRPESLRRSVDLDRGWREDDVGPCLAAERDIVVERARVAGEVLARTELRGIDEDRDDDGAA